MSTTPKHPFPSSFHPFPLHPNTTTTTTPKHSLDDPSSAGEPPTIESLKRPRGRPPGSKNKPKPTANNASPSSPPLPTSPSSDLLRPYILEIPPGHDLSSSLSFFSRRRDLVLAVLAATGPVSNVSLRQPSSSSSITFHGRFDLLSLSATFLPPSFSPPLPTVAGVLSVSLSGPRGQVFGGLVCGPLVAAGTVTVVAAAFGNPSFHRLPTDEEASVSGDGARSGELEANEEYPHRRNATEMTGTNNLLSDVIWTRGQHTSPY